MYESLYSYDYNEISGYYTKKLKDRVLWKVSLLDSEVEWLEPNEAEELYYSLLLDFPNTASQDLKSKVRAELVDYNKFMEWALNEER